MNSPFLVSCIMPTANRAAFVDRAVEHFLKQDYENRELVIVDDGREAVLSSIPRDRRILYLRLHEKKTVGAKRNLACRIAGGEIIVHWDDDDWLARRWLTYQVEFLLAGDADVCGLDRVYFHDPGQRKAWQYVYPGQGRPWVHGATLCYKKELWRKNPFPDMNVGEDVAFLWSAVPKKVVPHNGHELFVATIHPGNTSPKLTSDRCWHEIPESDILRLFQSQP